MKRVVVSVLVIANLVLAVLVFSSLNSGRAQQLTVSDLSYGRIDVDGDGQYTYGDDFNFQWLLANAPHHVEEALKTATVNEDGGVDLSAYLLQVRQNQE